MSSSPSSSLSHNELKAALFAHIRDKGVMKSLKGTLRKELLQVIPTSANSGDLVVLPQQISSPASTSPTDCLCESLIEGYLRHKDYSASRTVFLGETGLPTPSSFSQQQKSDDDLCSLLGLAQIGTNNQISNETCILTSLIRSQLKNSGRLVSFGGTEQRCQDVGIQCNISTSSTDRQHQGGGGFLISRDPNSLSNSTAYESIEYKLALVEQSFIRSNQVSEQNNRLQSEVNFSKLQNRIREECQVEARQMLAKWKQSEETLIRREEKLKAEERIQQTLREFKEMERKLRDEVETEKMKAEIQMRRISQEKLRLEEERNDLKKATYLRDQVKMADERELENLRAQLRESQSHSSALQSQVEHMQRQADLTKVAELRRLDLKEREINDLLAQLHESHERMAQVRFESRSLAEECAHSLDAAAKAAMLKRQSESKEVIAGGGHSSASVSRNREQNNVNNNNNHNNTSLIVFGNKQQQQAVSVPRKQQLPTNNIQQSSPSNSTPSSSNSRHSIPQQQIRHKDPVVHVPSSGKKQQQQEQQQQQPVVSTKKKSPSPEMEPETKPQPKKSPSPVQQQQKKPSPPPVAPSSSSSSSSDDDEKEFESSSSSEDDDEEAKVQDRNNTAAQIKKQEEQQRKEKLLAIEQQKQADEIAAAEKLKKEQEDKEAAVAASKAAENAELERKKERMLQQQRQNQTEFLTKISEPESNARDQLQEDATNLERFSSEEKIQRQIIEKRQEGNKIRHIVAKCETDYDSHRNGMIEEEDKTYRTMIWQHNHDLTLMKARSAKVEEEVYVPPPQVLKRDSDDSDYDSDNKVDIFGKNSDDEEDW